MFTQDKVAFAYKPAVMFEADAKFPFAREPNLRRMPDGTLLCQIYTGGVTEPSPENVSAIIRSDDDGRTWSKPEVLFHHPVLATLGTELFTEGPRPFIVFQTFPENENFCGLRSFLSFTEDSGHTWSTPVSFHGVPPNFCCRQGRVLADGAWVFPVYWVEQHGDWDQYFGQAQPWSDCNWRTVCGVIRSTDQGASWTIHGCLTGERSAYEPDLIECEPGHLKMYFRCDEYPAHVLWESDSFDGGLTWAKAAPSALSNPGCKFTMYKVHGRIIMINNVCTPDQPGRNRLELWVSGDGCRTWRRGFALATLQSGTTIPHVTYPHGFADDRQQLLYVAIDGMIKFYLLRIPYADLFPM